MWGEWGVRGDGGALAVGGQRDVAHLTLQEVDLQLVVEPGAWRWQIGMKQVYIEHTLDHV